VATRCAESVGASLRREAADPRLPSVRPLVRLFSLLIALVAVAQPAGALALASEVACALSEHEQAEAEDCPEEPCDDCPAGCPNCPCAPGLRSIVPGASLSVLAAAELGTAWACQRQFVVSSLDPPSVYRPPRSARSVA
jgi:hypothetical protein